MRQQRLQMLNDLVEQYGAELIRAELGVKEHTFNLYFRYPDHRLPKFHLLRRIELKLEGTR